MKRILIYGLGIVGLLVLGAGLAIAVLIKKAPVFTPAFTPPKEDVRELINKGESLNFPLTVPTGTAIGIFADLKNDLPRVLAFDPNEVLVTSITGKGKVVALPDADKNGKADRMVTLLSSLNRPHGIAFSDDWLYVAETNRVVRYPYDPASFRVGKGEELFKLPAGAGHFTRTIKIKGEKLYTAVGSSCNVCEEKENFRAVIMISDLDGKNLRIFAKGLRNTVFFIFDEKGKIWGNDMGRDLLGDNLPPDELNIIEDGGDYGWPLCYGGKVRDRRYQPEVTTTCEKTEAMLFGYPAHVAPLGLAFDGDNLLVAFHGSWNSSVPVGYKVIKLTLANDKVIKMEDWITGWLTGNEVLGRPVDLIFDEQKNLYISDDKAGLIYILYGVVE